MAHKVTLVKGQDNVIGISIGGGAPWCPILYVVQVFHRTPAAVDGSLQPGDELININDVVLKKRTRKEVASMYLICCATHMCMYVILDVPLLNYLCIIGSSYHYL